MIVGVAGIGVARALAVPVKFAPKLFFEIALFVLIISRVAVFVGFWILVGSVGVETDERLVLIDCSVDIPAEQDTSAMVVTRIMRLKYILFRISTCQTFGWTASINNWFQLSLIV